MKIGRRSVLTAPMLLAGCRRKQDLYFGSSTPPSTQRLIFEIGTEPSSLDPATSTGSSESYIWPALLETLVSSHPETLETRAGLATHYELDESRTEYTFFLRGHKAPRGMRLPGGPDLTDPALWNDGRPVTADDFVCAWRRVADPALGGGFQSLLSAVANGMEISEGKLPAEALGIRALDNSTLRVTLKAPAAHFLRIAGAAALAPVPRHSIQTYGDLWATPHRMPSCAPFFLHEWRPYDRIVLRRNAQHFDASRVQLQEIVFLPITDGATSVNLYKTGNAYAMHGRAVPPLWIPALRGRKDFHSVPAYRSLFYSFNTTRPPFDNVWLRYAFAMATDKGQITRFLNGAQIPARTLIPPLGGYQGVTTLPVGAGGRTWDVLSYDPESARELMKLANGGPTSVDLTFPNRIRSREMAEILRSQWRTNLGVHVNLVMMDWNVWIRTMVAGAYQGVSEVGMGADYADPAALLDAFNGREDGSGWVDPEFRRMLDQANAESEGPTRMRMLAAAEAHFLRAMPLLPVFFDAYSYLQKPYVVGLKANALDTPDFKDVWIDTNWRPN